MNYKISVFNGYEEVLFKTTSYKKLLQEIKEYSRVRKFNGYPLTFSVYANSDELAMITGTEIDFADKTIIEDLRSVLR